MAPRSVGRAWVPTMHERLFNHIIHHPVVRFLIFEIADDFARRSLRRQGSGISTVPLGWRERHAGHLATEAAPERCHV